MAYPTEKPEHSLLITEPMHSISLNLTTGIATVTFGEGETIDVDMRDDRDAASVGFMYAQTLAAHLAVDYKVWAYPERINLDIPEFDPEADRTKAPF